MQLLISEGVYFCLVWHLIYGSSLTCCRWSWDLNQHPDKHHSRDNWHHHSFLTQTSASSLNSMRDNSRENVWELYTYGMQCLTCELTSYIHVIRLNLRCFRGDFWSHSLACERSATDFWSNYLSRKVCISVLYDTWFTALFREKEPFGNEANYTVSNSVWMVPSMSAYLWCAGDVVH